MAAVDRRRVERWEAGGGRAWEAERRRDLRVPTFTMGERCRRFVEWPFAGQPDGHGA